MPMAPAKKPRGRKAKSVLTNSDIKTDSNVNTTLTSNVIDKPKRKYTKRKNTESNDNPKLENNNDDINDDINNDINDDINNDDNILAQITKNAETILEQEKEEEASLPKKKGRKPKNKMFTEKTQESEEPKKRGRKPKDKFGVVEQPKQEEVKTEDYILLQLPIKSKDLQAVEFTGDSILTYSDKLTPEPSSYSPELVYQNLGKNKHNVKETDSDNELNNNVINLNKTIPNLPPSVPNPLENNITKIIKEKAKPVEYTKQELQKRFENIKDIKFGPGHESLQIKQVKLMTQFTEALKRNEWPQSTKLHCFWCCHPFEGIPWGVPIKYINNLFHVDGNFCSPECAAAYNFDQKDFNMWERYMLLNLLFNKVNYPKYQKLKLAPPRRVLVEYGGSMNITEFRNHCQNYSKEYYVNFPPMIPVPTMAEEVNLSEHYKQKVVYMDQKRVDEASRRCQEHEQELMEHDDSLHNCFKRIANMA